jgi:DNA mismatch repair protein MutS
VAKLAGIPLAVLERARYIQAGLETKDLSLPLAGDPNAKKSLPKVAAAGQDGLFSPGDLVLAELASIDTDKLTPLEALNRIAKLKKRLQS